MTSLKVSLWNPILKDQDGGTSRVGRPENKAEVESSTRTDDKDGFDCWNCVSNGTLRIGAAYEETQTEKWEDAVADEEP